MMTTNKAPLALLIVLLMFPQLAQTLYSPALTDFSKAFNVPAEAASQAMTVYFLAFAAGVMLWGYVSDRIGRRPAMLAALLLYSAATLAALMVSSFTQLLLTQAVAAIGAAAGSVVSQTILRDHYKGPELAKVFSLVGMALALSPAIGLFTGAGLTRWFGYSGVMLSLLTLALVLVSWSSVSLAESRPADQAKVSFYSTLRTMLIDLNIWRSALLVAAFNIALLSYYAIGPFLFQRAGLDAALYGYSGAALAAGSALGAWLNRRLLQRNFTSNQLQTLAAFLVAAGGAGVLALQQSLWLLAPMTVVVIAFGMAIPNVLGQALTAYAGQLGSAGAVFGLMYYLLIGFGLLLTGWYQALGYTIVLCGLLCCVLCGLPRYTVRR
ncbi:MFS transporter [Paenalcaligenes sp. Me131]|uniref:MFS transporter n=1 Tax=Paenalcaligenes sp. Me131 TaxID=3392636 RepID=UPI003D2AE342